MSAGGRAINRGPGLHPINGCKWQTVATRRSAESSKSLYGSDRRSFHWGFCRLVWNGCLPRRTGNCADIATDPLWADFRDLALAHSLRACWSTPIFSSEGKVIGTFAMYYREPRSPSPLEQDTIKHITHLAGIAIQRKLAERARRESEAYLAEAQRLSHTGSWAWAPATGEIRYWSEETYRVLGFDPA